MVEAWPTVPEEIVNAPDRAVKRHGRREQVERFGIGHGIRDRQVIGADAAGARTERRHEGAGRQRSRPSISWPTAIVPLSTAVTVITSRGDRGRDLADLQALKVQIGLDDLRRR